jgi:riboflavin synthase
MFTGIIEAVGTVRDVQPEGTNVHFTVEGAFADEVRIDQSIAHDGVCLTAIALAPGTWTVTAIAETLSRTTLGTWRPGQRVNLERCMRLGDRLDGHIVQGHVDTTSRLAAVHDEHGSWRLHFDLAPEWTRLLAPKGSIALNGTSLTVVDVHAEGFSVALIPYTWEHTNFHTLPPGDHVNTEVDILAKHVDRLLAGMRGEGLGLRDEG